MAISPLHDGLEDFKKAWVGVVGRLKKEDFTKAIMKWGDRHTKCVQLEGDYVEKS